MNDYDFRIAALEKKIDGNGQPGLMTEVATMKAETIAIRAGQDLLAKKFDDAMAIALRCTAYIALSAASIIFAAIWDKVR